MKFALSTNWRAGREESGEEIAALALELGFDALELGFSTTPEQADGFRRSLDAIPVCSVHAFCPVPVSAPCGSPELYSLASPDGDARAIAVRRTLENIAFAAELGAGAVVMHAGRVSCASFLRRSAGTTALRELLTKCGGKTDDPKYRKALTRTRKARTANSRKTIDAFLASLDALAKPLETAGVTLALENLPYLEGFPDETETAEILRRSNGAPVKAWFDTGHQRVRKMHGWADAETPFAPVSSFAGMHVNDVKDFDDDHFAPGGGKVDFAALADFAAEVPRIVLEPKSHVSREDLERGLALLRETWKDAGK